MHRFKVHEILLDKKWLNITVCTLFKGIKFHCKNYCNNVWTSTKQIRSWSNRNPCNPEIVIFVDDFPHLGLNVCSDKRREIWNFLLTVLLTLPLKSSTRKLWNFISLFYIFFLFFFCFSNSSSDCKAKFFWVQFTWLLSCSDLNICGGDSSKAAKRWRKMNLIGFGIAGTNHSSRLCDFYLWILSGRGCGTFLP